MANELYTLFDNGNIQLYTEYPLVRSSLEQGKLSFEAVGTPDYSYKGRLQLKNSKVASVTINEKGKKLKTEKLENGFLNFTAKGGTEYSFELK